MKIAFFSHASVYNPGNIGGIESYIRRITGEFVSNGVSVYYVSYGNKNDLAYNAWGVTHLPNTDLVAALKTLEAGFDHVIEIYVLPKHRLQFANFRICNKRGIKFHFVLFNWADSFLKRFLYFAEARYFPYNGKLICISKRQYEYVSKWAKNAIFLLPPVPDTYFVAEKPRSDGRIRLVYLGRIDPGKGINDVIEIFSELRNNLQYECAIYGIHFPYDKASVEIHNRLKNQSQIKYIPVDRQEYSPAVDDSVRKILKDTDIFIQPYQKLSSTIDTPLLLLEAMASLCAVITKPFGGIPDVYGESKFVLAPEGFVQSAIALLMKTTRQTIAKEQRRLFERNKSLSFQTDSVATNFLKHINE